MFLILNIFGFKTYDSTSLVDQYANDGDNSIFLIEIILRPKKWPISLSV